MTVLIVGAAGFVGLALMEHLLARGDAVVAADLEALPPRALPGSRQCKLSLSAPPPPRPRPPEANAGQSARRDRRAEAARAAEEK